MLDVDKLAAVMLEGTKALVAKETAPLLSKIADLEAQLAVKPRDGKDADPDVIRSMVDEAVAAIPAPQDGKSVSVDDVAPLIEEAVSKAVAALPAPKDGESVDPEDVREMVKAAVAEIPVPKDGVSVTVEDVAPSLQEFVERMASERFAAAVAELPKPKDGKDADPAALDALRADVKALQDKPAPKLMVDADGELILAQDGELQKLGRVRGKDGAGFKAAEIDSDGVLVLRKDDGEPVRVGVVKGSDGMGFDDLDVVYDGERGLTFTMTRGDVAKSFEVNMPLVIDRGVFKSGTTYAPGDATTFGGSLWIAKRETDARPETDDSWRLAVKRGRDGRDGKAPVPQGPVKAMGGK